MEKRDGGRELVERRAIDEMEPESWSSAPANRKGKERWRQTTIWKGKERWWQSDGRENGDGVRVRSLTMEMEPESWSSAPANQKGKERWRQTAIWKGNERWRQSDGMENGDGVRGALFWASELSSSAGLLMV
ncbi:hypothetical protein Dimus_027246 [Dionaea muscipula]